MIKRELFILPQIEEYGVRKLRKKLVEAAELSIKGPNWKSKLSRFFRHFTTEVAKMVNRRASTAKRDNIQKISRDYGAYLRVAMNRMAVAKLGRKRKSNLQRR
jgi:guanylate kinase